MLSLVANLLALSWSFLTPPINAVYSSGPVRGTEACLESRRLPLNDDAAPQKMPAPSIAAKSAAVLTDDGHVWLEAKAPERRQAIASITKLMTALVFLEHNPGWEKEYTISRADMVEGGKVNLFLGETVRVKDLFNASLVASDNGATLALARSTGLSETEFILAMNNKAKDLGLLQTEFADPVGLSNNNLSNARDVARLAQAALSREEIEKSVALPAYRFQTLQGRDKLLESTDWLLDSSSSSALKALGGKTGYTDQAGYCFVGRFQDKDGRSVIVAVLDTGGKNERFLQARALASWAFTYCQW
ncbi:MAG: serine hydrolase [Patescibacteria group bacterium]|nr:serine hydrolase [Patescibacteria group bacterium]